MRKFKNIKICRKHTVIATMVTLPEVRFFTRFQPYHLQKGFVAR